MLHRIKAALYFPVAHYFAFFARIRLRRWAPRIVVVTGSNGKTTALHLIEARLGTRARYTHHRNSSFGIPFDILELDDAAGSRLKWFALVAQAPLRALRKAPIDKIYVVEADCDRPGEGKFLSELLSPEVVVWLNCARTHSAQFEDVVRSGTFENVDGAIAYEYGYFLEHASKLCIINSDDPRIVHEMERSGAQVSAITERDLQSYSVSTSGTEFEIYGARYALPYLLPKDVFRSIAASAAVAQYFGIQPTNDLSLFTQPPGRSSIFRGLRETTIVDSSYNANASSVEAILEMVRVLPGAKWLIFGDMTEQGGYEGEEHEKVAHLIAQSGFERVLLVGPRTRKFVLPILEKKGVRTDSYLDPSEVLKILPNSIDGGPPGQGEILVFKGARFLEGIIEHMLAEPSDVEKLCRREGVWRARRKEWNV